MGPLDPIGAGQIDSVFKIVIITIHNPVIVDIFGVRSPPPVRVVNVPFGSVDPGIIIS